MYHISFPIGRPEKINLEKGRRPTISRNAVGVWVTFQRWIVKGERSGLRTRTATENVTLSALTNYLHRFLNLKMSHAMPLIHDESGAVIETHESAGDFR
ncbi:MAG: hypothetical protein DME98_08240 [Verrucomicrobia bacterium]|nr:MAG: hypothetical protein DME98_08240 [Verrucomicrobiota bacterium]PYJ35959.1 MAG: hypothetical protein DME88_00220 [Verrucomicrobiota bacterium]